MSASVAKEDGVLACPLASKLAESIDMGKPVVVRRFRDEVHVIGDNVRIPLDTPRRLEAERAFKLIEELRTEAVAAAKVDMGLVEDDKVVIAFDFILDGEAAIVRVMQVAE